MREHPSPQHITKALQTLQRQRPAGQLCAAATLLIGQNPNGHATCGACGGASAIELLWSGSEETGLLPTQRIELCSAGCEQREDVGECSSCERSFADAEMSYRVSSDPLCVYCATLSHFGVDFDRPQQRYRYVADGEAYLNLTTVEALEELTMGDLFSTWWELQCGWCVPDNC